MKWFVDLVVHGKSATLRKLIPAIEARLDAHWSRDRHTEKWFAKSGDPDGPRYYAFLCRRTAGDVAFILTRRPGVIAVDTVRLYSGRNLMAHEYSALLGDFFWRFVKPAADEVGLKYFSSGFEDLCPAWNLQRRPLTAIERTFGFPVLLRLRLEGYISHFPTGDEPGDSPRDELCWSQN